ncbi:hypothetical protein B0I35DRAFT_422585 [Stachybotrys elegans]|uniref:25S rRNA (uridine-N(3))-methyltransferase BMT5-like domain-containing protein n=1 Tax=Stachybotrys elegans TaxID=80388 RepID=A0A8K0SYL3_9HYPO|nr:hypothetical protein B0I35DRAFT_422585 [Stachybotrys elegans]
MAKRRRIQPQKPSRAHHHDNPQNRPKAKPKPPPKPKKTAGPASRQQKKPEPPTIPFEPHHRILLVGEGDLSFAASLIEHHGCLDVTATVLEKDHAELKDKYPHVDANIAVINDSAAASDACKNRLLYGIDATKLPAAVSRGPLYNCILFNFPHVGGKSTDVNRQVRYNQELLVGFFGKALNNLAAMGKIVVTLFEGEPYTLWNIRDLARHAGLQVDRSFAFQSSAYPGYHHARTLGVVKNKKGETGGGWRGEERPSRSYIFMRQGDVPPPPISKKRRRGDDSSDDDEDD